MKPDRDNLQVRYGKSEHGNFWIDDTIGVPHPYCIGPKHVAYASDYRGGILDDDAVEAAERAGARCCTPRCQLKYRQHERALLVTCAAPIKDDDGKATPELHAYLLACKEKAEADKYVGFAFMEGKR